MHADEAAAGGRQSKQDKPPWLSKKRPVHLSPPLFSLFTLLGFLLFGSSSCPSCLRGESFDFDL